VDRPDRRGGRTRDTNQLLVAVDALRAGELVAFPTETVYGLGADAANAEAIRRLYAVKGRPADHPVIVHVARAAQLDDLARTVSDDAHALADAFWPGPLTLVVARDAARVTSEVTGGRDTVGIRVPDHPVALALLEAFGGGVAAPSANRFGRVSPTTAAHVRADLGTDVDVVLDGGAATVGVESTIVDCSGPAPAILRLGGVSANTIERIVGEPVALLTHGEVAAPGTLERHYSPTARVIVVEPLDAVAEARRLIEHGRRVGLLASTPPTGLAPEVTVLAAPADAAEFARVLYARLREADDRQLDELLVIAPEGEDIGAAVRDRLARAAAGSRLP
jgi:L-threonylcarbamoyladenylate synthase